eukprot:7396819-Pyramimonas_sp.AAC.2
MESKAHPKQSNRLHSEISAAGASVDVPDEQSVSVPPSKTPNAPSKLGDRGSPEASASGADGADGGSERQEARVWAKMGEDGSSSFRTASNNQRTEETPDIPASMAAMHLDSQNGENMKGGTSTFRRRILSNSKPSSSDEPPNGALNEGDNKKHKMYHAVNLAMYANRIKENKATYRSCAVQAVRSTSNKRCQVRASKRCEIKIARR